MIASESCYREGGDDVFFDFLPRDPFVEVETIAFRQVLLLLESLDPRGVHSFTRVVHVKGDGPPGTVSFVGVVGL